MQVTYVQPKGDRRTLEAKPKQTIMEVAVRNNVRGILAECGGSCACATCHVHIDPEWLAKVPPAKRDEQETLLLADNVTPASRLSCQIKMTPELDGIVVHLPA